VSKTDLKILMLEDDPLDAELNREYLRLLEEYNCIVNWVTDKASYLHSLQSDTPDIILSDYNIPGYNGLEALNDLNARGLLSPSLW
jgi:CheY-like chemotaxis protein